MPTVIQTGEVRVGQSGKGWKVLNLAGAQAFGEPAMVARRWVFEAGAEGPKTRQGDHDQLLYVIRGSGQALVDGEAFPLEPESVLWVEPGETFHFIGGPDGLEILQGYAPGD